jgi:hypothetical protein
MAQDKMEHRFKEWVKCKDDPYYFISNYIVIQEPGGDILLKPNEAQDKFIKSIIETHYTITLKSRQLGISTITRALIVHAMIFNSGIEVGIVSKDGPEATNFSRKTINMLDNLPDWMNPGFKKKTEQTFILNNDSELNAAAVSPAKPGNTLRGKPLTILVLDEAAFINRVDLAYSGMGVAVTKAQTTAARKGIPYFTAIISTPNGIKGDGEWYHDLWTQALKGNSLFEPIPLHWEMVKEFREDPTWYKKQCAVLNNNERLINQELELKFLGSQNALFPDHVINKLQEITNQIEPVEIIDLKIGVNSQLRIYERFTPKNFYIVGVDVASEFGSADSVITIHEYETMQQVAEFNGKLSITKFQSVIINIFKLFPNSIWVIENNSYGDKLVDDLYTQTILSDYMYLDIKKDKDGRIIRIKPGIPTNTRTRPLYIDALYDYIKDEPEIIKSKVMTMELISMEDVDGKIKSKDKDDLCMALGLICYVRNNIPKKELQNMTTLDIDKEDMDFMQNMINDRKENNALLGINGLSKDYNESTYVDKKDSIGYDPKIDDYDELWWIN